MARPKQRRSKVKFIGIQPQRIPMSEPFKKWECIVCGFIYDEEAGLPEEGIDPGTRWEDIPENWYCPDCGVGKEDFEMVPLD